MGHHFLKWLNRFAISDPENVTSLQGSSAMSPKFSQGKSGLTSKIIRNFQSARHGQVVSHSMGSDLSQIKQVSFGYLMSLPEIKWLIIESDLRGCPTYCDDTGLMGSVTSARLRLFQARLPGNDCRLIGYPVETTGCPWVRKGMPTSQ